MLKSMCDICNICDSNVRGNSYCGSHNDDVWVALEALQKLMCNQKDLNPEVVDVVNDNFWDLV